MVAGRTTEPRSVSVTTTSGSANITAPAGTFTEEDTGRPISGTGIPASATVTTTSSDTAATLSANATASGTVTAVIGVASASSVAPGLYGFVGWSPESDAESETYSVAAVNAGQTPPDRITNPYTAAGQRGRG